MFVAMQTFIIIVLLLGGAAWFYLNRPIFGKLPSGQRLQRVEASPNYKGGKFVNLEHTPDFGPGIGMWDVIKAMPNRPANGTPSKPLPSVKTNLATLGQGTSIVWFGHSSYLFKQDNFTLLVDPVFSGNASPVSFFAKSFDGTNTYSTADMPMLDVLLLTHDHYDHLDYETIFALKGKFKTIVTSLGVGAHLEHWGIPTEQIIELDWNQQSQLPNGFSITAVPARHFSGRLFTRAQSIWSAFVLETPNKKFFLGGDSGFGNHFEEIGKKHGPFHLALLECGQYNAMWPYIHMTPEEVVKAGMALKAEVIMPVHWGKFALAMHNWNEPPQRFVAAAKVAQVKYTIPQIGQPVVVDSHYPDSVWWDIE